MYEGEESNFDAAPPEESSNRTFVIAAGILGGIVLLSVACLAAYALLIAPRQRETAAAATAVQLTQNAQINNALTSTFQASILPAAIWDSIDVAADDLDLARFTAEVRQIETQLQALEAGEDEAAGSGAVEELERELIQIETEFRKG